MDGVVEGVINIFTEDRNEAFFCGGIEINCFDVFDFLGHLIDQELIMRWDELTAILIVHFFAVVCRQVMAGTEHVSGYGI